MSVVYHYAPWAYLPQMVTTGELRPSNAEAEGERAMLWFSAHSYWEPTATKSIRIGDAVQWLTFDEQVQRFGCVRFALAADDVRLMDWKTACKTAGTPREKRRALERAGIKRGANPDHWFATAVPIPLSDVRLQVFGGSWNDADPLEMADAWIRRHAQTGSSN